MPSSTQRPPPRASPPPGGGACTPRLPRRRLSSWLLIGISLPTSRTSWRGDGDKNSTAVERQFAAGPAKTATIPRGPRDGKTPPRVPLWGLLASGLLHLLHDLVQVEGGRLLPLRVLLERRQELGNEGLGGHEHERAVHDPVVVGVRGDVRPLVRVRPEVEELGEAQGGERLGPDAQRSRGPLLHEHELPVVIPQTGDLL